MKSSTKDHSAGSAKVVSGVLKEMTGKGIGDPGLQAKGKVEQAAGHTQKKVGKIKKVAVSARLALLDRQEQSALTALTARTEWTEWTEPLDLRDQQVRRARMERADLLNTPKSTI